MPTQLSNKRRNRQGLFSIVDLGRLLGETPQLMVYYIKHGKIPAPKTQWGTQSRRYYTKAEMAEIQTLWVE